MQYVNNQKTAAICNVCGNVIATRKDTLQSGNTKISIICPVCGTPDMDIIKNTVMQDKIDKPVPVDDTPKIGMKSGDKPRGRPKKKE